MYVVRSVTRSLIAGYDRAIFASQYHGKRAVGTVRDVNDGRKEGRKKCLPIFGGYAGCTSINRDLKKRRSDDSKATRSSVVPIVSYCTLRIGFYSVVGMRISDGFSFYVPTSPIVAR